MKLSAAQGCWLFLVWSRPGGAGGLLAGLNSWFCETAGFLGGPAFLGAAAALPGASPPCARLLWRFSGWAPGLRAPGALLGGDTLLLGILCGVDGGGALGGPAGEPGGCRAVPWRCLGLFKVNATTPLDLLAADFKSRLVPPETAGLPAPTLREAGGTDLPGPAEFLTAPP